MAGVPKVEALAGSSILVAAGSSATRRTPSSTGWRMPEAVGGNHDGARFGKAGEAGLGLVRRGKARLGWAWRGGARHGLGRWAMSAFDSAIAAAIRESTERCVPHQRWCREGARLRDEADDARDRWLDLIVKAKGFESLNDREDLLWALTLLSVHVVDCFAKVSS